MINWPRNYGPERAVVHVRNEIDIAAPAEVIWAWIVRAKLWPSWYPNSSNVLLDGGGPDLKPGSRFRWRTFGITLNSRVEEFVAPERLAWSARSSGVSAYHAWFIVSGPAGCHVFTEETQNGLLARMSNALRPNNMSRNHQIWLEQLKAKALSGMPPDSS